jgi:hypothetical protein
MLQTSHRSWSSFSPTVRIAIVAGGIVQIALFLAAQIDIARRPAQAIRGDKGMWRALAFINFLGPLAYFLFGRKPQPMEA